MPKQNFEQFIEKADEAARRGDWPTTIEALRSADKIQPDNAGILTGLGTCLIQMNQAAESIPYFKKVAQLAPDSAEAQNNLGFGYAFSRLFLEAETAYKEALKVNPEHLPAWKNLAGLYLQQAERAGEGVQILASIIKKFPDDVEALLLMADCYESAEEIESALTLYKKVLSLEPENLALKEKVKQLSGRGLGLDETKRAELVKKLGALKKKSQEVPQAPENNAAIKRMGFFAPAGSKGIFRLTKIASFLKSQGKEIFIGDETTEMDVASLDLVVFAEPLQSGEIIKKIHTCSQAKKPFVIDIDQDYFQIPVNHPAYRLYGPGNPESLKILEGMLKTAAWVMASSKVLAERYQPFAPDVKVFLPGWDPENPLWTKKSPARKTVNLGWVGSEGESSDLLMIKKDILRLMRECPEVTLVIAGDMQAYESFSAISEKRRIFFPACDPESLPYLLQRIDILIVPLQDNAYNQARPDELLLAAGVRGIPWVASAIPAYRDWENGGVIVEHPGLWYAEIQKLVKSNVIRQKLKEDGERKALLRRNEK